jgi:predicted PurR-regulated permease PerM
VSSDRTPFFSNAFVARAGRWGLVAWSLIGILILALGIVRFALYPIRVIFPPLLVAVVIVYMLDPLVVVLERRWHLRRVWAGLIVYAVFLAAVGLVIAYLISVVGHQATEFAKGVPNIIDRAQQGFSDAARRLGLHVSTRDLANAFESGGAASSFLGRLTSFTSGVVRVALTLVLGPLIAFYLLVDLPKVRRGAVALVPLSRRDEILGVGRRINVVVGSFFRNQLLVALLVGLASALGFWIVGLPYFALLGALTGFLALVPLIGILLAAVPALLVALAAPDVTPYGLPIRGGWPLAVATVIVLILVQQLDQRVLSRRLHTEEVRLHPVTVLLSLLIGGTLLGIWGMVLAVPVAASLKVILLHVWDTRSQWPPRMVPVPAAEEPDEGPETPPEQASAGGD